MEILELSAVGGVDGVRDGRLRNGDDGAAVVGGCDAVGDQLRGAVGRVRNAETGAKTVGGDEVGVAFGRGEAGGGVVLGGQEVDVEGVVFCFEVVVVDEQFSAAVGIGLDEAVIVAVLGPLVDETAGHYGHFGAVKGGNFVEDAGQDLVAAVLGEEDGDGGLDAR